MTNKVFVDYTTPIDAAWLNDVNTVVNTTLPAETAARIAADNLLAPLASPALTGTPTTPTAASGTNTTQVASTAFVATAIPANTHAASSKTTPVDADELPLSDSAASFGLAKLTWANLKTTLASTFVSLTSKDATGGYAGLTLFKINFKNAANTFTSFFTNSNTAARTYTFQDRDGTIADNTDIAGLSTTTGKLPTIGCTQATGALTFTASSLYLDFRSTTLTSGATTTVLSAPANLVLPSGGTLGAVTTVSARIVVVEINNAGAAELAVINIAGGNDLSETGVINTTAISAASTANNVFYSTSARTGVAYRVVGAVDAVNTAGAWGNPTRVQGAAGNALTAMSSLGYGQTYIDQTGSRALATTYYNPPGKPIFCSVSFTSTGNASGSITVAGVVIGRITQGFTAGAVVACTFIVPPNTSYSIAQDSASLTIVKWFELS